VPFSTVSACVVLMLFSQFRARAAEPFVMRRVRLFSSVCDRSCDQRCDQRAVTVRRSRPRSFALRFAPIVGGTWLYLSEVIAGGFRFARNRTGAREHSRCYSLRDRCDACAYVDPDGMSSSAHNALGMMSVHCHL
jgi:hypothetical protein